MIPSSSLTRISRITSHLAPAHTSAKQKSPLPIEFRRSTYRYFVDIQTRWMDNDQYGHVNNVNYYSFFDTAVNLFLQNECHMDLKEEIAYVVETKCTFKKAVSFPDVIKVGVAVKEIGTSSVKFLLAVFKAPRLGQAEEDTAAAAGYFVQVFVDKATERPKSVPAYLLEPLQALKV
eukprot:TRINITY_DN1496_c0_g1_i1.p1 TRINITY_DN1496_c0_g1~~TRINITY_DN1496_c0_g1_i1.p1  ORF type:complete len:176 (-),score=28.58 TRINITY_DN1496_c0_g1_i1:54-581(-)